MFYYVYKITNNLNGKWYIGKRKHHNPKNDSYMGSGKLILLAIKKYGKENFTKEILKVFQNNHEAAEYEASLLTKETIATDMSYNIHEGGYGGFAHINTGDATHIERAKRGGKVASERNKNHPKWGIGNFKINPENQKKASELGRGKSKGSKRTLEQKEKFSKAALINNNMKGKVWCIQKDNLDINSKKPFLKHDIPFDWITMSEYKDKKKICNGCYGKMWINNPIMKKNRFINKNDPIPDGWIKGRNIS